MMEAERVAVNEAILNANEAMKQQQETIDTLLHERDRVRFQVLVHLSICTYTGL